MYVDGVKDYINETEVTCELMDIHYKCNVTWNVSFFVFLH